MLKKYIPPPPKQQLGPLPDLTVKKINASQPFFLTFGELHSEHNEKVEDLAELLFAKYPPKHLPEESRAKPTVTGQGRALKAKAVQKMATIDAKHFSCGGMQLLDHFHFADHHVPP